MNHWFALRGIRLGLLLALVSFLAYALMVAEDAGTTFATYGGQGGLELKIDSKTTYNGVLQPKLSWHLKDLVPGKDRFFQFDDVKPGDYGTNLISLHVKKNSAYACLDFLNLKDKENGVNEPESLVDTNGVLGGELSSGLEFFSWIDDGDGLYESAERTLFGTSTKAATSTLRNRSYAVADAVTGAALAPFKTRYVGLYWCAGALSVTAGVAPVCNGTTLGNEVQTDAMTVDVRVRAVASAYQSKFLCTPGKGEKPKGNHGHGNDDDHNDDSNPGHSNDPADDTDDDGVPPGWQQVDKKRGVSRVVEVYERVIAWFRV